MAIQDDNTILNKGDLKAYHEAIAPMLGGTFMVRTNNSDFYSTDEKVVGVWTDGKPIYQRTVIVTSNFRDTTYVEGNYETLVSFKTIKKMSGTPYSYETTNFYATPTDFFFGYGGIAGDKRLYCRAICSDGNLLILEEIRYIFQYTKTTDTASTALTTPGAYDINFPNTWPENKEIYFGNGLYGYRKTGTVTAASDERNMITIATNTGGTIGIVNSGGWIKWGDEGSGNDYKYSINSTLTNLPGWGSMLGAWSTIRTVNSSICLWNTTGLVRTNAPYDIWVTYTK